jgi:hypothetical protein
VATPPYAPPETGDATPAVLAWFRGYALTMAALYLAGAGLASVALGDVAIALACAALAALHVVAAAAPRRPWGWTCGLVALACGVPSCALPLAIFLLRGWLRPEVKATFRRL